MEWTRTRRKGAATLLYVIILIGLIGFFQTGSMNAKGTDVSGVIITNTVWDTSGDPYIVVGNITVADGVTLSIEAGVRVKFEGYYSIFVDGVFHAIGTETNRINITSNKAIPSSGDWNRIQINSSGYAEIKYSNITYGDFGIYLYQSLPSNLSNNIISHNGNNGLSRGSGICLYSSSNNSITNNIFGANGIPSTEGGNIYLVSSMNNTIANNSFIESGQNVIHLESATDNNITGNEIKGSYLTGILLAFSSENKINENKISGVGGSSYGIHISSSSNNSISRNLVINWIAGIVGNLPGFNNNISHNNLSSNSYGILFDSNQGASGNNIIISNNISHNQIGIHLLLSANNNTIAHNNISYNWNGIDIGESSGNRLYLNNFISNSAYQAVDVSMGNLWNASYPVGGNYWSDNSPTCRDWYNGSVTPQTAGLHDGICDVERNIFDSGIDYYPLKFAHGTLPPSDYTPPAITDLQPADKSMTNDSALTVGASYGDSSGIDLSTVLIKVDGVDVTSLAAVETSNIKYIPGIAFSDGLHNTYLEVRDKSGNLGTSAWSFNVDTTHPMIHSLQPPDSSIIASNTPTISATYSDLLSDISVGSVSLKVNELDVTSSSIVTASSVMYVPTSTLVDGLHNVSLEVRDTVGNLAAEMWSFTVDTKPPMITNLQPLDYSITNDSTPTISAEYDDPSGVGTAFILVDTTDVTSSATLTASNITYTPTIPLSDGLHNIYLEVKDSKSNLATEMWSFTIDTTIPTITDLQPSNSSTTKDNTPVIGCNFSDSSGIDLSSVSLKVDGIDMTSLATIKPIGVSYIPEVFILTEGVHNISLEVKDIIGNIARATWSFTVEKTKPTIMNLQPLDAKATNDENIPISADFIDSSGIDVNSVKLKVDNIEVTNMATVTANGVVYNPLLGLVDGLHTIYLEVRDTVGNLASVTWSFVVDATPPEIHDFNPFNTATTNNQRPSISANYTDSSGIRLSSVMLKVDSVEVTGFAVMTAGGITFTPLSSLADGAHSVYLVIEDTVDNLAIAAWSFIVDTIPPSIINLMPPQTSTTNNRLPSISATYGDSSGINLAAISLKVDNISITYYATISASVISYTPLAELSDGFHWIHLMVEDNAGNLAITSWHFVIEATPPSIVNEYLQPPDKSVTYDNTPTIKAAFSDLSGIDTSGIVLRVNGVDVTSEAAVTASIITYTPAKRLSDGTYSVELEVKDNCGNFAKISWSFSVVTPPSQLSTGFPWWIASMVIILVLILLYILLRVGMWNKE